VKLTFYNDRLMSTEFSTESGREYLTKLKEHTKFRYDIDPHGKFRFSWTDPKIESEWLKWVRDNS